MADIATNLQKLVDDRDDMRTALVAKGVSAASNHGFDDFADDIASIESGGYQKGTASLISYPYCNSGMYLSYSSAFANGDKIELLFVVIVGGGSPPKNVSKGTFIFNISGLNLPKQNYTCEIYDVKFENYSTNGFKSYGSFVSATYNNDILELTITDTSTRSVSYAFFFNLVLS